MPKGIARKLIIYLTLMVIIVEGGFALINNNSQKKQLLEKMNLRADLVSQTIVSTTWHAMLEDRRESVYQMMDNVGRQQSIQKVRIFNKSGRIMFSSGEDKDQIVDIDAEACDLCHAKDQPLVHVDVPTRTRIFREANGERVMGMVTPIYNERPAARPPATPIPRTSTCWAWSTSPCPWPTVDRQLANLSCARSCCRRSRS